MNELSQLGLSNAEAKKLTSVGLTSVQQIAMANPAMMGLSEGKAETIIRAARQITATQAVSRIEVPASRKEVVVYLARIDQSIRVSVEAVLGASTRTVAISVKNNLITFSQKNAFQKAFRDLQSAARQWQTLVEAQRKEAQLRDGITLDRKAIRNIAAKKGFTGFWNEVFAGIIGNDVMKKALSVSLFSTFDEPAHTLVIGDPGSAKTLARDIVVGNFGSVSTVGANSTRSGLVCNLATGEAGALAAGHQKVVLIDEFDKIDGPDVQACYELMSNGRCTVHSARVHQDIVSKFILIAFGNPATATFTSNPMYDIELESTLLSRFAFVVRTDTLRDADKKKLFSDIFTGKMHLLNLPPEYDQWVKLARRHEPRMRVKENTLSTLSDRLIRIFDDLADTPLRRDLRMGNHVRRIALSLARAEFSDVTEKTVEQTMALVEENVRQWDA